jgi:hypothetical protein
MRRAFPFGCERTGKAGKHHERVTWAGTAVTQADCVGLLWRRVSGSQRSPRGLLDWAGCGAEVRQWVCMTL